MLIVHFAFGIGTPSVPKSAPDIEPEAGAPEKVSAAVPYGPPNFRAAIQYPALPEVKGGATPQVKTAKNAAKKIAPAYEKLHVTGKPKIAIIIDDMGVDRRRSQQVIDMDAALTLAFLPYAQSLDDITARAKEKGHELMIHMPMQATTNPVSLGPIALKSGMSKKDVQENLQQAFESFDGYVGLNNHMGSKVTQDPQLMSWVMETLKKRGIFFIDSKTIGRSVGVETARLYGLPTAERDVFLDHEDTPEFVAGALNKLERVAARQGYAIAIGHPKDATINGLKGWIKDAQARGFEIVHASALLERPKGAREEKIAQVGPAPKPEIVAVAEPVQDNVDAREDILRALLGQE